jgi:hypothetical protein
MRRPVVVKGKMCLNFVFSARLRSDQREAIELLTGENKPPIPS